MDRPVSVTHISTTGEGLVHEQEVNDAIKKKGRGPMDIQHSCSITGDPQTGPYILHSTLLIWSE